MLATICSTDEMTLSFCVRLVSKRSVRVFVASSMCTLVTPGRSRDSPTICDAHGRHMSSMISIETSPCPGARSSLSAACTRCGGGGATAGVPQAVNRMTKRTSAERMSTLCARRSGGREGCELARGFGAVALLSDVLLDVADAFLDVALDLVALTRPLRGPVADDL